MKRLIAFLTVACLVTAALATIQAAAFEPARTRFDSSPRGKWAFTLSLGSSVDTTIDVNWEICQAGALVFSGTALISPAFDTTVVIRDQDPSGYFTGRPIAPSRVGRPLMFWDADTLWATSSRNRWDYCCGDARGIRIRTYGAPARIRLWISGRCH